MDRLPIGIVIQYIDETRGVQRLGVIKGYAKNGYTVSVGKLGQLKKVHSRAVTGIKGKMKENIPLTHTNIRVMLQLLGDKTIKERLGS